MASCEADNNCRGASADEQGKGGAVAQDQQLSGTSHLPRRIPICADSMDPSNATAAASNAVTSAPVIAEGSVICGGSACSMGGCVPPVSKGGCSYCHSCGSASETATASNSCSSGGQKLTAELVRAMAEDRRALVKQLRQVTAQQQQLSQKWQQQQQQHQHGGGQLGTMEEEPWGGGTSRLVRGGASPGQRPRVLRGAECRCKVVSIFLGK